MSQMIFRAPTAFFDDDGQAYEIRVMGRQDGHVWHGWIEFHSRDGRVMRTGSETTQPSLALLEYWSSGLEPIYFEGAFERARRHEAELRP